MSKKAVQLLAQFSQHADDAMQLARQCNAADGLSSWYDASNKYVAAVAKVIDKVEPLAAALEHAKQDSSTLLLFGLYVKRSIPSPDLLSQGFIPVEQQSLALQMWAALQAQLDAAKIRLNGLRPPKVNPRDKFCYERMRKGDSLAIIRAAVNNRDKRDDWYEIHTDQGISQAARRHAIAHNLPWPLNV